MSSSPPDAQDCLINLRERVALGHGLIRLGVHVNQCESKRLFRRRAANAELRYEGRSLEQAVWIVDRIDAVGIYFDRRSVVNECVLFFAIRVPESGADDFVVRAAIGIYIGAQKVIDEMFVFGADLLDRDEVEVLNDGRQGLHHDRL